MNVSVVKAFNSLLNVKMCVLILVKVANVYKSQLSSAKRGIKADLGSKKVFTITAKHFLRLEENNTEMCRLELTQNESFFPSTRNQCHV